MNLFNCFTVFDSGFSKLSSTLDQAGVSRNLLKIPNNEQLFCEISFFSDENKVCCFYLLTTFLMHFKLALKD